MPDSKQLVILKALTTHLDGMSVEGGYGFDMAGRVFRGRAVYGDEMPLPCLSILEAPRPDETPRPYSHENLRRIEDWVLLVQGWVQDDKDHPTDTAYELKAHVEARLSEIIALDSGGRPTHPAAYRLGPGQSGKGLIAGATIGPGVVSPPRQNVSAKAFFYLPLVLRAAYNPAAPFDT
jgi:hypothetical protein